MRGMPKEYAIAARCAILGNRMIIAARHNTGETLIIIPDHLADERAGHQSTILTHIPSSIVRSGRVDTKA